MLIDKLELFFLKIADINSNLKKKIIILADLLSITFITFAVAFIFNKNEINVVFPISISFFTIIFLYLLQSYKNITRYLSLKVYLNILISIILAHLIYEYIFNDEYNFQTYFTNITIVYLWLFLTRQIYKEVHFFLKNKKNSIPIAIYGAGDAGMSLYRSIKHTQYNIKFFIDDSQSIQNKFIYGKKILSFESFKHQFKNFKIKLVLFCIPSIKNERKRKILNDLLDLGLAIKCTPSLKTLIQNNKKISNLENVDIEDLLGREKINLQKKTYLDEVLNKTILVTGAGGSIGKELSLQILQNYPNKIILLDHSELALFNLKSLIKQNKKFNKIDIYYFPISIINRNRLINIFKEFQIYTVFHAAAYKHVDMMQQNIIDLTINNIIGTKNLIEVANKFKIYNFILVSTDKAVNPSNYMGLSKKISEMICYAYLNSRVKLTMVRFGNVIGSSGSVITIFQNQIDNSLPLTVTDKQVERYLMSINEAVELILVSCSMEHKNSIYILDMGKPIKILDIAKKMIRLSGKNYSYKKHSDDATLIKFTGLKEGEKLSEELSTKIDNLQKTHHKKINRINIKSFDKKLFKKYFNHLEKNALEGNLKLLISYLNKVNDLY